MSILIQKLHPALYPGQRLALAGSRQPLFSRQGMWDSGCALYCAAMALAMLGELSDPVSVRDYANGPVARFWDRAWPHYLHGLTFSELASFVWKLKPMCSLLSAKALLMKSCASAPGNWLRDGR
ncbi:hypothetical protein CBA19CS11_02800 [Caballeronia novacaledonica]|uniref:hypothetical protein n=1 Tax=Caballeronia novacaledonica TaxID=1544861 RepID=UPI001EE16E54|nr:hypothetical protein [Caballeronia novacaledonica]GJH07720.1 hypothetical protein CBA19CS11_02800 [Caballeronia novacaledonica]